MSHFHKIMTFPHNFSPGGGQQPVASGRRLVASGGRRPAASGSLRVVSAASDRVPGLATIQQPAGGRRQVGEKANVRYIYPLSKLLKLDS